VKCVNQYEIENLGVIWTALHQCGGNWCKTLVKRLVFTLADICFWVVLWFSLSKTKYHNSL